MHHENASSDDDDETKPNFDNASMQFLILLPEEDVLLEALSKFGFVFIMFLVGVKMDPSMAWKVGRRGQVIGVESTFPPVIPVRDVTILGLVLDAQGIVQGALYDNQLKNQVLE